MPSFFNPYHFVPLRKPTIVVPLSQAPAVRHDLYVDNTLSGSIRCRLKTRTSTIVGSEQRQGSADTPGQVSQYRLDGKIAIPASTLRGMVSAIAEAASHSAPRVLHNGILSYRKKMTESLSAVGMVFRNDKGSFLLPLTLPTLRPEERTQLPLPYRGLYQDWSLKVYLWDQDTITDPDFDERTFQLLHKPDNRVYGLRLGRGEINKDGSRGPGNQQFHERAGYLLAQEPLDDNYDPLPWNDIPEPDRRAYTPGVLRILGSNNRDIPDTRKHELFIPVPRSMVAGGQISDLKGLTLIPIPEDTLDCFHMLADERLALCGDDDPLVPYYPQYTRNPQTLRDKKIFRLQTGDLVFFRPELRKGHPVVAELSLSSIWRDCVRKEGAAQPATTWDFFQKQSDDLVPAHRMPEARPRTGVTPAELLFGFVEQLPEQEDGKKPETPAVALSSRVRFSAARLAQDMDESKVLEQRNGRTWRPILKILGSPKPPSPALYFRSHKPPYEHTAKAKLNLVDHQPHGRKFYLHSQPAQIETHITQDAGDYKRNFKQKLQVELIRPGISFDFRIDFDNLTESELGLLLFSLEPSDTFQHKIGLAKSLGLGSVKLEVTGVDRIDRRRRYTPEGFSSSRSEAMSATEWKRHAADFRTKMDPVTLRALEIIGDPNSTAGAPVHAPLQNWQLSGDPRDREDRTFSWFVANDDEKATQVRQALQPLDAPSKDQIRLQPLQTNGPNHRPKLQR